MWKTYILSGGAGGCMFALMKLPRGLLYLGVFVVGFALWRKFTALGRLVVSPGNVKSMSFVGSTPVLVVSILIQNTSQESISVDSFAANAYTDGTFIGNVSNFTPVVIPASGSIEVDLTLQLQALSIVNTILSAFQYKNFQKTVRLEGYAHVSGLQVPVDLSFTIG